MLYEEVELERAMMLAFSSIILEMPMIIANVKSKSQNSLFFWASFKETLPPFLIINLSVSDGFPKFFLTSSTFRKEIDITGMSKFTPRTIHKNLEPQEVYN